MSPEPPKYARLLCGGSLLSSEQINSALINSLCCIQAEACVMHILKVYVGAFSQVSDHLEEAISWH